LPNGTLVAYERACTHVGVSVDYNSKTHMLVCPAHGAIFDPAHGGRVLQGPATRPLPQVPLRPGSDGTILIGDASVLPPGQGESTKGLLQTEAPGVWEERSHDS